jgi:hypothetical protein
MRGAVRMNGFRFALIAGTFAAASLAASLEAMAEPACTAVTVPSTVEAEKEELSLTELLRGGCQPLREAASHVSLGAVPRAGSVRVFDGRRIRGQLEEVWEELAGPDLGQQQISSIEIPERIMVRRAGETKSCEEITRFVREAALAQSANAPAWRQQGLDCAAARGIPETAPLELAQTAWNAALRRWEFSLRCSHAGDCVPFLVWSGEAKTAESGARHHSAVLTESRESFDSLALSPSNSPVIRRGQTATLIWDEVGIRVVVPVTCLDGGAVGQVVRVQLKNGPRILRAEVVGEGMLRAAL